MVFHLYTQKLGKEHELGRTPITGPRRLALLALGLAGVAVAMPLALAGAQAPVRFTIGSGNSPRDLSSQAMIRWAEAMQRGSNGALAGNFVGGGALGGDRQLLQRLKAGEIQLHVSGPTVVHHLARTYQCLEAEFVFRDEAHGLRVWQGALGRELNELLERDHGVRIVAVGRRGARHLTSSRPVRSPDDLRGMKVRVTNPLRAQVFQAMGALPGTLPIDELHGALRAGVFDAQENPISTIWGNRYHEVQKAVNLTGHVWSYTVVTANARFVRGLSPAHKATFDRTLAETMAWLAEETANEEESLLKRMQAERGIEIVRPDVAAFQRIAQPIVARFAAERCRSGLLDDIAKAAE